jgi:predicted GNAT superfamily acetyltransferase
MFVPVNHYLVHMHRTAGRYNPGMATTLDASPSETALSDARERLDPRRWGCAPLPGGWSTSRPEIGDIHIARLGWQSVRNSAGVGAASGPDALNFLANLQGEVWGMPAEEWVPANILAILPDTGGTVLAAYRADVGWNERGWLGFGLAGGSRSGVLVSHMLGVRANLRGEHDIGWLLKAIQAYEAVAAGHHAAMWTFDPMRGANARLNLEKLGATVSLLTFDKYGAIRSDLYGNVPSDRFTATWDLLAPDTAHRLAEVHEGLRHSPSPESIAELPPACPESSQDQVRYAIPGDIDRLARENPEAANDWRHDMRRVLGSLLDTSDAAPVGRGDDPASTALTRTEGSYTITGFATGRDQQGERRNEYILTRRQDRAGSTPS